MTPLIDYECLIQDLYEAILFPGQVAIDLGAHCGRHTFPLAECVYPNGKVHAIEPIPELTHQLQQTLSSDYSHLAETITVHNHACSNVHGEQPFVVAEQCMPFSGLRTVPYPHATSTKEILVRVETLDDFSAELPRLDFLKIDAEGAELLILQGARACLERFRPVVSFEFGTIANAVYDTMPQEMARFWLDQDYALFSITGQSLQEDSFVTSARKRNLWDYVAVPREKHDLLQCVAQTLKASRVNWLAVQAELNHAKDFVHIGERIPPLQSLPFWLRPIGKGVAWSFLKIATMITAPQRYYNQALWNAATKLTTDLQNQNRHLQRQIHRLQAQIESLSANDAAADFSESTKETGY